MTEIEQVKALVELDGIEVTPAGSWRYSGCSWNSFSLPSYLTSYNAIIPLIQKQPEFASGMMNGHIDFTMTPSQLCEALLRATRKWKE